MEKTGNGWLPADSMIINQVIVWWNLPDMQPGWNIAIKATEINMQKKKKIVKQKSKFASRNIFNFLDEELSVLIHFWLVVFLSSFPP